MVRKATSVSSLWVQDVISGRRRGWAAAGMRGLLSLATPGYRSAVALRNRGYDRRRLPVTNVSALVISVGNLTTGGTGKTPTVAWIVDWLVSHGRRPAILSRGYRALAGAENDEKRVLDALCPGIPHVQNPDRAAAAERAINEFHVDVLVLDDGFQHRRLARDLDIVLIDALNPFGYDRLLPRGLLREPRSSLRRADFILVTRFDQVAEAAGRRLCDQLAQETDAPIVSSCFVPVGLVDASGRTAAADILREQRVGAFCGIGNPTGFRRTLETAGIRLEPQAFQVYPDHHHYSIHDMEHLAAWARALRLEALVATRKDLVKLVPSGTFPCPMWGVDIRLSLATADGIGEGVLDGLLTRCVNRNF